jgi:predicted GTPase
VPGAAGGRGKSRTAVGTPIDLGRLVKIDQPVVRARYELQEIGRPDLADALKPLLSARTEKTLARE